MELKALSAQIASAATMDIAARSPEQSLSPVESTDPCMCKSSPVSFLEIFSFEKYTEYLDLPNLIIVS